MSKHIDLNTKFRISPKDAAYALSISHEKLAKLAENEVLTCRGGKYLRNEIENLLEMVYSHRFPKNIDDKKKRHTILHAFCKPGEIVNYKTRKGA